MHGTLILSVEHLRQSAPVAELPIQQNPPGRLHKQNQHLESQSQRSSPKFHTNAPYLSDLLKSLLCTFTEALTWLCSAQVRVPPDTVNPPL